MANEKMHRADGRKETGEKYIFAKKNIFLADQKLYLILKL